MSHPNFIRSEKAKLLAVVSDLSHRLQRPVCSADLIAHFRAFPDSRPILIQRLGQQLLKATRLSKLGVPHLVQVGVFGNRGYYAPDQSPRWQMQFRNYTNGETLKAFFQLRYPDRIRYLLGGPFDTLARNGIAGWIKESTHLIENCPAHLLRHDLEREIGRVKPLAGSEFVESMPDDLISRFQAASFIQSILDARSPFRRGMRINIARYLVKLSWPQSQLFPPSPELCYSQRQLEAFVRSKWPLANENEEEEAAICWGLRYPLKNGLKTV